jgi:hypothetical protein
MEIEKCHRCDRRVLYLETKRRIETAEPPPVQKDGLCPVCWTEAHPGEPVPRLPGWEWELARYNTAMHRDHQHNPDPNQNAARIVADATADQAGPVADLEAAWVAWSTHIQKVDERGMTLLRAAFEAGWEAGRMS